MPQEPVHHLLPAIPGGPQHRHANHADRILRALEHITQLRRCGETERFVSHTGRVRTPAWMGVRGRRLAPRDGATRRIAGYVDGYQHRPGPRSTTRLARGPDTIRCLAGV